MDERLKKSISRLSNLYRQHFVLYICLKLVIIGLGLRLVLQNSSLISLNENSALTLLMGQDILDGRFSVFRYGHNFAGTLEYLVIAPLVAIFGMTDAVSKIIPLVFLIATSVLLWKGFERTPYKDKMRIAMAILWIWPGYFVFSSSSISGFLSALLLLYAGILFSSYYAAHSLVNRRYYFLFAFLSGLALWVYPLSFIFSFVCLLWVRKSSPAIKQFNLRALSLFMLGSILWWAKLIADRGANLFRSFEKSVGSTKNFYSNNGESLLVFLDIKTVDSQSFIAGNLNLGFAVLYLISITAIAAAIVYGIRKALKTKKTDFAFLSVSLLLSYIAAGLSFWIFSIELGPSFYIGFVLPICFVAIFALDSKLFLGLGVSAMFIVSMFSLISSTKSTDTPSQNRVAQITKELEAKKISRAIASHTLSYPIIVESRNDINVSPFDYNAFDQKRAREIQADIEAIVAEQNDKNQTDIALCVQGAFGTAFERSSVATTDIYIVPKELRNQTWEIIELCKQRT